MNNTFDISDHANKSTRTTLEDLVSQLDRQNPSALRNSGESVTFTFEPRDAYACAVVEDLQKEGIFNKILLRSPEGLYLLTPIFHNGPHKSAPVEPGSYYQIEFIPDELDKWILRNIKRTNAPKQKLDLPRDVKWDDIKCILTLGEDGQTVSLNRSSDYTKLFKIYIDNHGVYVPHTDVLNDHSRFKQAKILTMIQSLRRRFKDTDRVAFESENNGAYRLVIT